MWCFADFALSRGEQKKITHTTPVVRVDDNFLHEWKILKFDELATFSIDCVWLKKNNQCHSCVRQSINERRATQNDKRNIEKLQKLMFTFEITKRKLDVILCVYQQHFYIETYNSIIFYNVLEYSCPQWIIENQLQ